MEETSATRDERLVPEKPDRVGEPRINGLGAVKTIPDTNRPFIVAVGQPVTIPPITQVTIHRQPPVRAAGSVTRTVPKA